MKSNPYDPPLVPAGQSTRNSYRSEFFRIPFMFFAIHSVAMVLFAFNQPPPTGPNANANSLIWVCWVWVDFPLGFLSLYFAHSLFPESSFGSIATYFLVGGLQWFVWGILFQFIVKMLTTSKQINNN